MKINCYWFQIEFLSVRQPSLPCSIALYLIHFPRVAVRIWDFELFYCINPEPKKYLYFFYKQITIVGHRKKEQGEKGSEKDIGQCHMYRKNMCTNDLKFHCEYHTEMTDRVILQNATINVYLFIFYICGSCLSLPLLIKFILACVV